MLRHRRDVVLALGAAVLGSACLAVVPLIERQIVDHVIVGHTSPLWPWLVLLIVLAAAAFGLAYVRRYHGGRVGLAAQYDLRNAMHDRLQDMDFDNLDRMPTGQLVARANSDSTLVQGLLNFLPIMSGNVLLMLLSLGIMIYLSPARQLAGVLTIGQQARAGVERIFQLLDLQPAITDAPGAVELTDVLGEITFVDVQFAYGDGPPVLRSSGRDRHPLPSARSRLPPVPVGSPTTGGLLLPVRAVPRRGRRRHRPGGRCGAYRPRSPHVGGAHRLHPLHRPVLLADSAVVAGVRCLAADPRLGRQSGGDRSPPASAS